MRDTKFNKKGVFTIKNIDIIIPCYNSASTLPCTLASIAMQSIKEQCNIYLCDDCGTDDYTEIINTFSSMLDITYLRAEKNGGAGLTRQLGIDHSNNPYIIFIDSDDTFYGSFAVEQLYNSIKNNYEIAYGNFVEELRIDDNLTQINHTPNATWLHGKIFSREFLSKNNIRFAEFRLNEDGYFLQLAWNYLTKPNYINEPVYIWHNNKNSLVRNINDNLVRYKLLYSYIDVQISLYKEKLNRNIDNSSISLQQSVDALILLYFYFNEIFIEFGEEYGNEFINKSIDFYKYVWNDIRLICKNTYLTERYASILETNNFNQIIPVMTLYDFVSTIKRLAVSK